MGEGGDNSEFFSFLTSHTLSLTRYIDICIDTQMLGVPMLSPGFSALCICFPNGLTGS